jgi:hypothetical protein
MNKYAASLGHGHFSIPVSIARASAFSIPTATPESDGPREWDAAVLVLVEAEAGGKTSMGFSYRDTGTAKLIHDTLAPVVTGAMRLLYDFCMLDWAKRQFRQILGHLREDIHKDKYETSIQVGELVLLAAMRACESATLIVADGYSWREQIAQTTDRHCSHLAEVIHSALQASARSQGKEAPWAQA